MKRLFLLMSIALLLTACQTGDETPDVKVPSPQAEEARPLSDWVDERVAESKQRLEGSEAGRLVWKSIQAHGGLDRWFSNGPIFFRFDYQPLGDGTVRDTYQTVDTWRSLARHEMADDRDTEFGWDGEQAWVYPADAELELNPRFWALTPYYFVAMPFVLADAGVQLESLDDAELRGETYDIVKVTFAEGTGDAPDDYYIVYFDKKTSEVAALRYVVSYPGFFPEGGHTPEKLMVYEGGISLDGITLAQNYPTYKWDAQTGVPGEKVTAIEMSALDFRPGLAKTFFEAPEGARMIEGY